jgi:DNA polymerase-1
LNVVHVSMDKDMLQLIEDGVFVMQPTWTRDIFGVEEVRAKYQIVPSQFSDYQALIGDTAVSHAHIM